MYYTKICPICSKAFDCLKVSTIFCSKKCNNRTRYLPRHMIAELVRRNNAYSIQATGRTAIVLDGVGRSKTVGYIPEGATEEHPAGKDTGLLEGHARVARDIRENQNRLLELEKSGDTGMEAVEDVPQDTELSKPDALDAYDPDVLEGKENKENTEKSIT